MLSPHFIIYIHIPNNKKHMSLCPSGWYQFLKIWPLAQGLKV